MYQLEIQVDDAETRGWYEKAINDRNEAYKVDNFGVFCQDSGFDLVVPYDHDLKEDGPLVDFGVKCSARGPCYNEHFKSNSTRPTGFYMYARSSIYKTPVRLANSVGIIDSGYRGNIKAAVDVVDLAGDTVLKKGTRITQICMPDLSYFNVTLVSKLPDTHRGNNGFGSSGV